jgi:hypothetical protein
MDKVNYENDQKKEAFEHTGQYPKNKNEMRNAYENANHDLLTFAETQDWNRSHR